MSGQLWAEWTSKQTNMLSAVLKPQNDCPALLLTVWLSPVDGLWRACTEFYKHFGSWASPSEFATQVLAQEWAEMHAEAIASTYPPPAAPR